MRCNIIDHIQAELINVCAAFITSILHSFWHLVGKHFIYQTCYFCVDHNIPTNIVIHSHCPEWDTSAWQPKMCMDYCVKLKAFFSITKIIPKSTQMYTLYTNFYCTSLSPSLIILDKDNFVKVSFQTSSLESCENTPKGWTVSHKSSFSPYK